MIGKELLNKTLSSIKEYIDSIEKKLEIDIDNLHFDVTDKVEEGNKNPVSSDAVYKFIEGTKGNLRTVYSAPELDEDLSNNWYTFCEIAPTKQSEGQLVDGTIYTTIGGIIQGSSLDLNDTGIFNMRVGFRRNGVCPSIYTIKYYEKNGAYDSKFRYVYITPVMLSGDSTTFLNYFKIYYEYVQENWFKMWIVCKPNIQNTSLEIKLLTLLAEPDKVNLKLNDEKPLTSTTNLINIPANASSTEQTRTENGQVIHYGLLDFK